MKPGINARRWQNVALQVIISLVAFGSGWHFASKATHDASTLPAKNPASRSAGGKRYSATDLAQVRADLVKVLKTPGDAERQHALLDFIAGLDAATVKNLMASVMTSMRSKQPIPDAYDAMSSLIDRLTELDPKGALDWTQGLHSSQGKMQDLQQIFNDWSAQNPAAALAALRALPAGIQTAAAGYVPFSNNSATLYSDLFGAWAGNDPAAAAKGALNLPPSASRDQSLTAVAIAWAQQDPTAALAWANTLPTGPAKDDAVNAAIQTMSSQNPQAAADLATALPGTPDRDALLTNIARNWAQQDPAAALAWADNSLTGNAHDAAVDAALTSYAFSDPAAAANYYVTQVSNSTTGSNNVPLFEIAYSWAAQDSQAALNWALALPAPDPAATSPTNPGLRQEILSNVISTWSQHDPMGAAAYLQQNLTTEPNFGVLASSVARNWANADPTAALTWAQSLPAGDAQNTTLTAVVTSMAQFDPQTAFNDAQQLAGDSGNTALGSIITTWAMQQPDQAAAALDSLPPGPTLTAATASVAGQWLQQDPNAASQWIDTLPQGPARDGAVTAIISNVGQNDPSAAYNWAVTIGNSETRNTQVVKLATQWSAKDPAAAATAAQNALNLSGLTQAQVNSLQKIVAKAPSP